MKIARLPDGSLVEFPPDFPDDEMDRAVRQKLGVPEPPDSGQMLAGLVDQVMQMLAEMQAAQQQADQNVMSALQMIAQAVGTIAGGSDETTRLLAEGFGRLEQAMRAPRSLVTGPNGQPIGVKVGETI